MPKPLWLLGLAAALALLSGCGSLGPDTDGAAAAAREFHRATADQDGPAACQTLSVRTARELEQSEDEPCAQAVLKADVPDASDVRDVQVWGGRGLVVLDGDVVFVAEFDAGWRVVAAGCSARKDRPYECTVKGG
jgi:hypothetical protein